MKKLFVFVSMKYKTAREITNRINECKKEVENIIKEDVEVTYGLITVKAPDSANEGVWITAKYMDKMAFADIVYFDRDFEKDTICSTAFIAAVKNRIPMVIRNEGDNLRTIFYKNKWRGFLYTKPLTDSEEKPNTLVMGAKTLNMISDEFGLF